MTPERILTFGFALMVALGVVVEVWTAVVQPAFASVAAAGLGG